MAQKPISTAAAERMNFVTQDRICPALSSAKFGTLGDDEEGMSTVSAWGFPSLGTVFQLIQDEEEPPTPKPKIELPPWFHVRPVTPVEKYIKVLPSPPVPKTTQGFIGWRSAVPSLNKCLEHDYEIRSCKGAYAKELNWPKEGIY
uniref:Ciliary microtubule inner protein 1 n=1 Tax=Rhinolophus ferrumequinum TaxID=59479 RepID=A0A671G2R3_RHIFE